MDNYYVVKQTQMRDWKVGVRFVCFRHRFYTKSSFPAISGQEKVEHQWNIGTFSSTCQGRVA